MSDAHKITQVSVSVKSAEPLIGVVLVSTVNTEIKFEITEDLAHKICTDLERFLTQ
jgi:hypothetical protein